MTRALAAIRAALGYFTILPGGCGSGTGPDAAALAALPLVGAAVGALAGGAGAVAGLALPRPAAAAVAVGSVVVLTGAIHVDGFLDGCDAFVASVTPARRREILKDPHHGTFAVAGMFAVGALWLAALADRPPRGYPAALAFASAFARTVALANGFAIADARRPLAAPYLASCAIVGVAGFALLRRPVAVAALPLGMACSLGLGGWIARRLGGAFPGDAFGFVVVVSEVGTLLVLAAAGARPG